jgi:cytochrome P450
LSGHDVLEPAQRLACAIMPSTDRARAAQEDVVPENTVALAAARAETTVPDHGPGPGTPDDRPSRCPVSRGADGSWTLSRHEDVVAAARDDVTFSNATSRFLKVPNGLDGDEHTAFRQLVDRYFTADRLSVLRPTLARIADEVVDEALDGTGRPGRREGAALDAVALAARYAVRASCAWLGWPAELETELLRWIAANRGATRSGQIERTTEAASWFDRIVREQVVARRPRSGPARDVTAELVDDESLGRRLTDEEITSILRNWTGGDLDSLALCAGVVLAYLADHPDLQTRVRGGVSDRELDAIIDETLRIDDPFVSNRRVATSDAVVNGQRIAGGDRVVFSWTAANRDPEVFGDPDAFDPGGNAPHNLVYGVGRHVCPGRGLATMELRLLTRAVLARGQSLTADPDRPRERSCPPSGGYARVPLLLR